MARIDIGWDADIEQLKDVSREACDALDAIVRVDGSVAYMKAAKIRRRLGYAIRMAEDYITALHSVSAEITAFNLKEGSKNGT